MWTRLGISRPLSLKIRHKYKGRSLHRLVGVNEIPDCSQDAHNSAGPAGYKEKLLRLQKQLGYTKTDTAVNSDFNINPYSTAAPTEVKIR